MKEVRVGHIVRDKAKVTTYIGRENRRLGLAKSIWANPYHIGKDGSRSDVLKSYKTYLYQKMKDSPQFRNQVRMLEGEVLGCFCRTLDGVTHTNACHGDILAKAVSFMNVPFAEMVTDHLRVLYAHMDTQSKYLGDELDYSFDMFKDWALNRTQVFSYLVDYMAHKDEDMLPMVSRVVDRSYRLECIRIIPKHLSKRKRVIVAGSRDISPMDRIEDLMGSLYHECKDTVIISGMAKGPDLIGLAKARLIGLETAEFPAIWRDADGKYIPSAGYLRNALMASKATHLVAYWDGTSSGTQHMIKLAEKHKLFRTVHHVEETKL